MANEQDLDKLRHSLAHLTAAAVLEMYPEAKPTIGPAIENGFYYDFDFGDTKISEEDLPKIEKKMKELLPSWASFERIEVNEEEARKKFQNNPYKLELIDEIVKSEQELTFYKSGEFIDLCRGGHVNNPSKDINPDAFTLDRLAGAYWRGDENNPMLTRIYGLAFESKKGLDDYLVQREEAVKRDHKKIGKELELFAFSELVGPGLPMMLPKGELVKHELENFIRSEKQALGYSFVSIPHIAKAALYEKSGHLGKYDAMMPKMTDENGDEFVMKAMNCPHHFEIYNSQLHSYRDLPLRLAENTAVYRNEKSGELSGLVRVKSLTQDDTHHFVRHDQIQDELQMILDLMQKVYTLFGFKDYNVQISVRDQQNKEKYFGDDKVWDMAEKALVEAVKKWGADFVIEEGEAAFYGPKIDIMVKDSIGRTWQLATVQLDFVQPENFQMRYTGEDGQEHAPAVIHAAIFGSLERFMGILIEHFAGAFPVWLSPVQVAILPISDKHLDYVKETANVLRNDGLRVETDERTESVGKKIREATVQKIPYMLIVGDKEIADKAVAVRTRGGEDLGVLPVEDFINKIKKEIKDKTLS